MISKNTLQFLKSLAENNNREWFEKHKPEYQQLQIAFKNSLTELVSQMQKFDPSLINVDVSKAVFRIYRDVRFSKDKSPYKTNFGAWINQAGKNSIYAGYYLHVQPGGNSFAGAGCYMPEAANLNKIRQEIDYNPQEFKKIISAKKFKDHFKELDDFKLKTLPKGYSADNPMIEFLKQKSIIASANFKDSEITKQDFMKSLTETYKAAFPLVQFLNKALT